LSLYCGFVPFFDKFRINPKGWPGRKGISFQNIRKAIFAFIFNNIILSIPLAYLTIWTKGDEDGYGDTNLANFPSALKCAWQMLTFLFCEDISFYFMHRLLHTSFLYKHVHKYHHSFHHSVSIAATAAHPVEFIVGNTIPFILGPRLIGAHLGVMWSWMILRMCSATEGHSGFSFPYSPFELLPTAEFHDAHHSLNTGNYGSFFPLWDLVFGTYISFIKSE
jgi:sterol desaturase/sphingolipid hydroxylase (fatty acid hydroxylase superfamily)